MSSLEALKNPPPVKYNDRGKAGEAVLSFNLKGWPAISPCAIPKKVCCVVSGKKFATNITLPYRHMFTVTSDRAQALENQLVLVGEQMIKKYGMCSGENGMAPLEQVNVASQGTVLCVGRICNEAS